MNSDYISKTTKMWADEVDISKIYTNKYDALNGLNNVKITDSNQSWKSENLRYEVHDDGSVLIYNDGVPIGWSTIEELNLDTTKTMEQKEQEHASKEQQRRNAENQAAKEKAGALAQEEERRNAGTSSNEGKTPEEIEASKAALAQQKKNQEVADVNAENVDNQSYSHTLDDFNYQKRTVGAMNAKYSQSLDEFQYYQRTNEAMAAKAATAAESAGNMHPATGVGANNQLTSAFNPSTTNFNKPAPSLVPPISNVNGKSAIDFGDNAQPQTQGNPTLDNYMQGHIMGNTEQTQNAIATMKETNASLGITGEGVMASGFYSDDYHPGKSYVKVQYDNADVYLNTFNLEPHEVVFKNGETKMYNADGTIYTDKRYQ